MSPRDREILDRCYQKCVKGNKLKKQEEKVQKVIKDKAIEKANRKETNQIVPDLENSPKEGIVLAAGSTRAQLMENCKQKGIKNFRVLNKQELTDCLANIGDQKKIDLIVAGAVARWKAGWKANKEVVGVK
jgi:hypothetical protein